MSAKLKDRVLGFAFNQDRTHILLLKSIGVRTPVQLEVPGGDAAFNEALVGALTREFKLSTGLDVAPERWKGFAAMSRLASETRCLLAELTKAEEQMPLVRNARWYGLDDPRITKLGASYLRWLIPLALCDEGQRYVNGTYWD